MPVTRAFAHRRGNGGKSPLLRGVHAKRAGFDWFRSIPPAPLVAEVHDRFVAGNSGAGAVVNAAQTHKIDTPANWACWKLVKALAD